MGTVVFNSNKGDEMQRQAWVMEIVNGSGKVVRRERFTASEDQATARRQTARALLRRGSCMTVRLVRP